MTEKKTPTHKPKQEESHRKANNLQTAVNNTNDLLQQLKQLMLLESVSQLFRCVRVNILYTSINSESERLHAGLHHNISNKTTGNQQERRDMNK